MAKKDLYSHATVHQIIDPVTATATTASETIDLKSHQGCLIVVNVGESGDTLSGTVYWTMTVTESDDDSTYTAVGAGDLVGEVSGNNFGTCDAAAEDDAAFTVGYAGSSRYVKATVTATGTHSNGTPIAATAIKFGKKYA